MPEIVSIKNKKAFSSKKDIYSLPKSKVGTLVTSIYSPLQGTLGFKEKYPKNQYVEIKSYGATHDNSYDIDLTGIELKTSFVIENSFDDIDIVAAIEQAKSSAYQQDNEIEIIPVPEYVWDIAKFFLVTYIKWIITEYGISVDIPDISICPDGSIDIQWYNKKGKILINIDNSLQKKAYYYSDFHNKRHPLKGNIEVYNGVEESLSIRIKKLFDND